MVNTSILSCLYTFVLFFPFIFILFDLLNNNPIFAGISYGHDVSVEFKDADVVICIGYAREYDFKDNEYLEPFFEEHVLTSKFYVLIIIIYQFQCYFVQC